MTSTYEQMQATIDRWKSRALIAENKLRLAGLPGGESVDIWDDDSFLVATLTHKNGDPVVTIDQLNAARKRVSLRALR